MILAGSKDLDESNLILGFLRSFDCRPSSRKALGVHAAREVCTMHLTDLIASRSDPFHTFEFFPPRTDAGFVNLLDRVRRLAASPLPPPLAVSITWGAGGGTADRTMELAEQVTKLGLEVILHLTCTNMAKEKVDEALAVGQSYYCI